jgi:hypothetical protein
MNNKQKARSWKSPKSGVGPIVAAGFIILTAYGMRAQAQVASHSGGGPVVVPSLEGGNVVTRVPVHWLLAAASPQCTSVQRWDPSMGMCMPNGKTEHKTEIDGATSPQNATTSPGVGAAPTPSAPSSCPSDRSFDPTMNMCMPGAGKTEAALMFQINQFALYSSTFGPRGQSRFTGPGMWMLMYDKALSPTNHLRIDVMGSPEQLTVGDKGTPQLLQTEHIDSMHAHDTIMALEFRDVITLDTEDKQMLTFLLAPRGEAAVGPVPFMHRDSAEGNPDAPLGHALQDGFHDVSTVLGIEYQLARTAVEVTAFSGQGVSWPVPLHSPDSYSLRVNQAIDDHFSVGASYADVLLPDDTGASEHNRFISSWLTTSHQFNGDTLKSSLIWGQARASHSGALNSFLEEVVYQRGNNKIYGRAEVLQITPMQLDLVLASGGTDAKWVKALTAGYERTLFKKDKLSLFVGGSYTQDFVPADFQPAYGSDPGGGKVYLRIKIDSL